MFALPSTADRPTTAAAALPYLVITLLGTLVIATGSAAQSVDAGAAQPPPDAPAAEGAAQAGALTKAPAVLEAVEPVLDADAPLLTEASEVVLELTIGVDGGATDVAVLRGLDPYRDVAAADALRRFRFSPAEIDGAATAVRIEYRLGFSATPAPTAEPAEPVADDPAPAPAATPSGRLQGQLLQRGTRQPLAGARVRLPALQRETLADGEGRFRFDDVPAGEVELVVEDPDHAGLTEHEQVADGEATHVVYYVEAEGFGQADLEAIGHRPQKEVVRRRIARDEIETVPGTQGDALKVIQTMPGAARMPFGEGGIVLRGGGNSEVYVEGHLSRNVFHFGGLRSAISNGLLESIDVYPGNYSARYGNANGGIVDIRLRAPRRDRWHGFAQVDLFDASAFLEVPLSDNTAMAIGGRRSYIDALMPLMLDDETMDTFSVAPRYYDYQLMVDHDAGRDALRFTLLGSYDRMRLLQEDPATDDPSIRGDIDVTEQWLSAQGTWRHRLSADTSNELMVGYLLGDADSRVGADFELGFQYHTWTLRDVLEHRFSDAVTLRLGPDIMVSRLVFDVTAPQPPKEGQPQLPLSAIPLLHADGAMVLTQPAAWAEVDVQLGPALLVPGVRLEHFSHADSLEGDLLVQPRFNARLAVTDTTTLKGGLGLYSNQADIDELNDVFGNPQLGPERSLHYAVGVEQRLTDALLVDATGFYKSLFDQVTPVDDPVLKYDNSGEGRAYGLELMVKHDRQGRFYGWAAYTLMRSERKDAFDEEFRIFELDQTHNLTLVGNYRLGQTWEVGARFRYVTGNPDTPYEGAVYDSDADTFVPVPGKTFSTRQSAFHQLDLRVDKHFIFDTWRLTTYLDVQNVYNRANAEATAYNYDYTEKTTVAGLPIIPSIGAKGEF